MKNIFLLILLVAATFLGKAQAPQNIPYQAVLRNTDGSPMASTTVTLTFSIHNLTVVGDVVYQETQSPTTNTQGLVSLIIGSGTPVTSSFAAINWATGAKFLQVTLNAGNGDIDLGTQQMMSVPYALYAENLNVRVSNTGDTLYIGNNYSIVPGVSAANPVSISNYGSVLLPGNTTCQNEYISVTGCGGQDSLLYYDRYYSLVEIGGQCWFAENLATDKYANGDNIPTGLSNAQWTNTSSGAFAIYNNSSSNDLIYGKLYNWYTTIDGRGLCPTGWHVPSDCEWMFMEGSLEVNALDLENIGWRGSIGGGKLKSINGWNSPNTGATNESGFNAISVSTKNYDGTYSSIGSGGYWWSRSSYQSINWSGAYHRELNYGSSAIFRNISNSFNYGFSIRCLKN